MSKGRNVSIILLIIIVVILVCVNWMHPVIKIIDKGKSENDPFSNKVTKYSASVTLNKDNGSPQNNAINLKSSSNNAIVKDCLTGETVYEYNNAFKTRALSLRNVQGNHSESTDMRKKSFTSVYTKFDWGRISENNKMVHSGSGSTLSYTPEAMGVLHTVINFIKKKTGKSQLTMLDIPCGDMTWMSRFLKTRDDINYTGVDIVPEVISGHKNQYAKNTNWKFINTDILHKNTTISQYDLVFSRMMMQHLFLADVMKLLTKISESGSKYVLMTTHITSLNTEVVGSALGRYRPLNLQIAPYKLIPPLCLTRDGPPHILDHLLALWKLPLRSVEDCNVNSYKDTRMKHNQLYQVCGKRLVQR